MFEKIFDKFTVSLKSSKEELGNKKVENKNIKNSKITINGDIIGNSDSKINQSGIQIIGENLVSQEMINRIIEEKISK